MNFGSRAHSAWRKAQREKDSGQLAVGSKNSVKCRVLRDMEE